MPPSALPTRLSLFAAEPECGAPVARAPVAAEVLVRSQLADASVHPTAASTT